MPDRRNLSLVRCGTAVLFAVKQYYAVKFMSRLLPYLRRLHPFVEGAKLKKYQWTRAIWEIRMLWPMLPLQHWLFRTCKPKLAATYTLRHPRLLSEATLPDLISNHRYHLDYSRSRYWFFSCAQHSVCSHFSIHVDRSWRSFVNYAWNIIVTFILIFLLWKDWSYFKFYSCVF